MQIESAREIRRGECATYCVGSLDGFRLLAEAKVLLAAKHLEDELAIEDGNFWLELFDLLQQHFGAVLDLLARQIGTAFRWSLHHICESDAVLHKLKVLLGCHLNGGESREVQALPEVIARAGIVMTFVGCKQSRIDANLNVRLEGKRLVNRSERRRLVQLEINFYKLTMIMSRLLVK